MDSKNYIEKLKELQSKIIKAEINATEADKLNIQAAEEEFVSQIRNFGQQALTLSNYNFFTLKDKMVKTARKVLPLEEQKTVIDRMSDFKTITAFKIFANPDNIKYFVENPKHQQYFVNEFKNFEEELLFCKDSLNSTLESFNSLFEAFGMEPENINGFYTLNSAPSLDKLEIADFVRDVAGGIIEDVSESLKKSKSLNFDNVSEEIEKLVEGLNVETKSDFETLKADKNVKDFLWKLSPENPERIKTPDELKIFLSEHISELERVLKAETKDVIFSGVKEGVKNAELSDDYTFKKPIKDDDGLGL